MENKIIEFGSADELVMGGDDGNAEGNAKQRVW
ncbi:hypothetical protein Cyrtocomes_00530 [Candidatus Cyrtobacter comes]|uniref:Uncharacterized protein n=1 Tax=Candidatus Cyrtobacter comes TaxID=675776 RepID=A0ABU5L8H5_9RICK|nr:hypothetical protein [Candidatus Cyrtobacter comes]